MSPQLSSGNKVVERLKPSDVDDEYITEMTVRLKKLRALMAEQKPKKKSAQLKKTTKNKSSGAGRTKSKAKS